MATTSFSMETATRSVLVGPTDVPGVWDTSGVGITGGYTGNYLPLQILIAFFLGLSLYNAVELLILLFSTFQQYHGLYFWSLFVASMGIIPYSSGFIIKYFSLLNTQSAVGYVAIVLLTIGWWTMVTGQSVVLWSRLHLVTSSRRVLRWTKYMIIANAILLHFPTTVLTFGSNSYSLPPATLDRFVYGYSIMEKIQMVGFFLQEFTLSGIYIFETIKLLRLSESVQDEVLDDDASDTPNMKSQQVRKTMYQLLAINIAIITMDLALLGIELANLYLIETTLKGVVYSIKLRLEYAVLGKLVQLIRNHNNSNRSSLSNLHRRMGSSEYRLGSSEYRLSLPVVKLPDSESVVEITPESGALLKDNMSTHAYQHVPDMRRMSGDITTADLAVHADDWETRSAEESEKGRRRAKAHRRSWLDEEMDRHNIG